MSEYLGKTIGEFQLVETVDESGSAMVFKGFQPAMNRYVAVKVLKPSTAPLYPGLQPEPSVPLGAHDRAEFQRRHRPVRLWRLAGQPGPGGFDDRRGVSVGQAGCSRRLDTGPGRWVAQHRRRHGGRHDEFRQRRDRDGRGILAHRDGCHHTAGFGIGQASGKMIPTRH
jgi:hypothetical protein